MIDEEEYKRLRLMGTDIRKFLKESNAIEGIFYDIPEKHVNETVRFLMLESLSLKDLKKIVEVFQPGAKIRDKLEMNVRVGSYHPPLGGPKLVKDITQLLKDINDKKLKPWDAHIRYETLHPFMDGNGRSGRLVWLWHMYHMGTEPQLSFLHHFYYQTLQNVGR